MTDDLELIEEIRKRNSAPLVHTPGPWIKEFVEGEFLISGSTDGHQHFTAISKDEANAHLIAAAPCMLEALENVRVIDGGIPDFVQQMISSAIKKARGE